MKSDLYNRRFSAKESLFLNFSFFLLLSLQTINTQGQKSDMNSFPVLRLNEVNNYAARHLLTNFSSSTDVKWFREKHHYIAICKDGESTVRVYYKVNGNFEYCIKYYLADALDQNLKSIILNKFPGSKIMIITEVTNLEKKELYIKIKDGAYLRTVHFSDEGMEIAENIIDISP